MKKYFIILICLSISTWTVAQQKANQYAIKSGYVEYKLEGNTTGTKKVWWDNFGEKSKTEIQSETTTNIFGMKNVDQAHTIEILIKDKYWAINLKEKTGSKGTLPYYKASKTYVESMSEKEQKEFADQMIASLGGKRLGNETVKGYNCEVMTVMDSKIWMYKGVTVKSEAKILGMESNEIAVKLDFNSSISGNTFIAPSNIKYADIDQEQEVHGGIGNMTALNEAFSEEGYGEGENEDDFETIPVKYPYANFQTKINKFEFENYKKIMCLSAEGAHTAMFSRSMVESLIVSAVSSENRDISKEGQFETFTSNGKKCMYGIIDDEEEEDENTLLIVEIPKHETYIMLVSTPPQTKAEMLELFNELEF